MLIVRGLDLLTTGHVLPTNDVRLINPKVSRVNTVPSPTPYLSYSRVHSLVLFVKVEDYACGRKCRLFEIELVNFDDSVFHFRI